MSAKGRHRLVKLVRDRIDEFVGDSTVSYEVIDTQEGVRRALRRKLIEEAIEYLENPCMDEAVDVFEVLRSLVTVDVGTTWNELEEAALAKRNERGGFLHGIGMYCHTERESA